MTEPCNVFDYERLAEQRLEPGAFGYFAGGAGDEHTLRENVEAYRRWQLRHQVHPDVGRQLHRQRSQPRLEGALGRQVGDVVLVGPRHPGVRQRHHRPAPPPQLLGQGVDQQERRDGVHHQRLLQILPPQLAQGGPRERPAGEHQIVHAAAPIARRRCAPARPGRAGRR